jgi:hypothetical protein
MRASVNAAMSSAVSWAWCGRSAAVGCWAEASVEPAIVSMVVPAISAFHYPATCVYAMTKAAVATMVNLAMAQKAAAFNERLWDWNDDDLAHLAALLRRLTAVPAMG